MDLQTDAPSYYRSNPVSGLKYIRQALLCNELGKTLTKLKSCFRQQLATQKKRNFFMLNSCFLNYKLKIIMHSDKAI